MKIIEIIADSGYLDTIVSIATQKGEIDHWYGSKNEDGRQSVRLLVDDGQRQAILDALQSMMTGDSRARIVVTPVEAALPRPTVSEEETKVQQKRALTTTREELYDGIEKGARLDTNFILLVMLSTIVAAIGLIEDNVAVVIGAMVIAPLLGPNIALALAATLGDTALMWKSLKTNVVGVSMALGISIAIGLLWPVNIQSHELLARTDVGMDAVALALASGAAAVLSLTTGLSSVLVGVMVAVALLPPTATLGLMLGSNQPTLAIGAALLLSVNVVCVNLAAKVVLLAKGVRPRTWLEKEKARQSMITYLILWIATLAVLIAAIILRQQFPL